MIKFETMYRETYAYVRARTYGHRLQDVPCVNVRNNHLRFTKEVYRSFMQYLQMINNESENYQNMIDFKINVHIKAQCRELYRLSVDV